MAIWHVSGGNRLEGKMPVQGSKNAALPILAASLLAPAQTELLNVPELSDVNATMSIIRALGGKAERDGGNVYIDSRHLTGCTIERGMMRSMRSSVLFMGALIARFGEVRLSYPGGCRIGERPIDMHLAAMRSLGCTIAEDGEDIVCRADRLRGAHIRLKYPSVGATENAMIAACGADGETVIDNAAREPEITDLQEFLRRAGAYISGAGSERIVISGFEPERRAGYRVMPDRVAAATYICAAAAAGGDIELLCVYPEHFSSLLHFLKRSGCDIISGQNSVRIRSSGKLKAAGSVVTAPYPGFATDMQPLLAAAMLKAEGVTEICEEVFSSRFEYASELNKLGADISVSGRKAMITGVKSLHGAKMRSCDLRGGAAMITAALAAEGESTISDAGHILRGYEYFDSRLRSIGADVSLEL